MERIIFIFAILSLGHAQNLHHDHAISLRLRGYHEKWLSCRGTGTDCQFRSCPGEQNEPFARGGENDYKCKGEVFWIHKPRGGEIQNCDVVALEYETGWWLSCSRVEGVGKKCLTRTCPGDSWGDNWDRCGDEKFRINVVEKKCGDRINNGDIVGFYNAENNSRTVSYEYINPEDRNSTSSYVRVGDANSEGFAFRFKIFIDL